MANTNHDPGSAPWLVQLKVTTAVSGTWGHEPLPSDLGRFQHVPRLLGHLAGGLLEVVTARCVKHRTR
jgi:hypothetical protein